MENLSFTFTKCALRIKFDGIFIFHFVSFYEDCEHARVYAIVIKLLSDITMEKFLKKID